MLLLLTISDGVDDNGYGVSVRTVTMMKIVMAMIMILIKNLMIIVITVVVGVIMHDRSDGGDSGSTRGSSDVKFVVMNVKMMAHTVMVIIVVMM